VSACGGADLLGGRAQQPAERDNRRRVNLAVWSLLNSLGRLRRPNTRRCFANASESNDRRNVLAVVTSQDARSRNGLPAVHPRVDLPRNVRIYEVAPRDGLQAERAVIPLDVKLSLIDRLADAGLHIIEATSFVSPRWVPQLADADQLLTQLNRRSDVRYPVLVPNQRGFDRAMAVGADEIAVFVSASEWFAKENLGTSLEGALQMAAPVVRQAVTRGIPVRGYISMCFGDPWEGRVDPIQPATVAARLVELGCSTISLGDTIGVATPGQISAVVDAVEAAGVAKSLLALHLHDTYGQALANVLAGLEAGITEFDSSAGGVGGCPFARSATGNLATEDLVWMLEGLGIPTRIDLALLARTSRWLAEKLGRPAPSRVVAALTG
jgi:hydroxymethylglutaryl-CoA lyase